LPGLYNVYNALAATATALELGVGPQSVRAALEGFGAAFGRVETIPVEGRDVSILLVKNPAGANEVLRTLALEEGELDLWLALNDKIADGRDVPGYGITDFGCWPGGRRVMCSGRGREMTLRLKYAGVEASRWWTAIWSSLGRRCDRDGGAPAPCHTACSAARPWLAAAWPGGGRTELAGVRGPRDRLARRRVRRLPPTSPLARAGRRAAAVLDVGCGSGRGPGPGRRERGDGVDSERPLVGRAPHRTSDLPASTLAADRRLPRCAAPMRSYS
jgi:hypothetical protein